MAYSIKADLLKRVSNQDLIDWTQDDPDAASPDDADINEAILKADAKIDGYIGTQYDVPLSPVPELVEAFSVDIAIYNLFTSRPHSYSDDNVIVKRFNDAIKDLKEISKGNMTLGLSTPPSSSNVQGTKISSSARKFSRSSLEGM